MNQKLLSLYGLKYNPFAQDVPMETLLSTAKIDSFLWRLENAQVREGGFALVSGDPGTGKSTVMRLVADRLRRLGELTVGELEHPQSNVADFYRELGDMFDVQLRPHNRWAGFRTLRERWQTHIDATLLRPVLWVDEAQQMSAAVMTELRVLSSHPARYAHHSHRGVGWRFAPTRAAAARGAAAAWQPTEKPASARLRHARGTARLPASPTACRGQRQPHDERADDDARRARRWQLPRPREPRLGLARRRCSA